MIHPNSEYTPKSLGHPNFRDLTGQRFGRLTVVQYLGQRLPRVANHWECLCDCGATTHVRQQQLTKQTTQSCGCLLKEWTGNMSRTHGRTKTPEYISYHEARKRCQNPNVIRYPQYGGRGIEFRFKSFEEFYAELGDKPTPKHSVNRIDNNGHYEIGNVEWATPETQVSNKQNTHRITINDNTMTLSEWARFSGTDVRIIDARMRRLGWCTECAIFLPSRSRCPHTRHTANGKWAE